LLFQLLRGTLYLISRLYFRIEFHGLAEVPREGPLIIAPNHGSYLDPIWVSLPLPRRFRYMTWDRVVAAPLLGRLVRALGAFPVKADTGDRAALRLSLEHLRGVPSHHWQVCELCGGLFMDRLLELTLSQPIIQEKHTQFKPQMVNKKRPIERLCCSLIL